MPKYTLLMMILFLSFNSFAQGWNLKKDDRGIKIFTRSIPNSQFKEYKATTIIPTSIATVLDELLDAPSYTEKAATGKSYYVSARGTDQHLFYARKELPWPLKNRDIVTLLTVEKISEKKIKLHLESLPNGIPLINKTIRIKELMGHWLLEEKNGKTEVTQQLYLDPGGSLPPVITNSLLVKGPFKTFSELHKTCAR